MSLPLDEDAANMIVRRKSALKLTNVEVSSSLWHKLVAHYTPVLDKLRLRAENPALSEVERLPLLYKIAHIKELFAMAELDDK